MQVIHPLEQLEQDTPLINVPLGHCCTHILSNKYQPPEHAMHRLAPLGQETQEDDEQGRHVLVVVAAPVTALVMVVLATYMEGGQLL